MFSQTLSALCFTPVPTDRHKPASPVIRGMFTLVMSLAAGTALFRGKVVQRTLGHALGVDATPIERLLDRGGAR